MPDFTIRGNPSAIRERARLTSEKGTIFDDTGEALSKIDVSGWTIQYASASGTTWDATPLSGSIQPGRYYLVQLASAAAVGSPLPTPDATGTTNLANAGGKVALVRDSARRNAMVGSGQTVLTATVEDLRDHAARLAAEIRRVQNATNRRQSSLPFQEN